MKLFGSIEIRETTCYTSNRLKGNSRDYTYANYTFWKYIKVFEKHKLLYLFNRK